MDELFNKVSNWSGDNTGNAIMTGGDTTMLVEAMYKCSDGTCAQNTKMLVTDDLYGMITCKSDSAGCIINGESQRRGMQVKGTYTQKLTLRALAFFGGQKNRGGGLAIEGGAKVDLFLCNFSSCKSTGDSTGDGGGAIIIGSSETEVNIYSTRFNGNIAASGNGNDIYNFPDSPGSITIHNTCPSPYTERTSTKGNTE